MASEWRCVCSRCQKLRSSPKYFRVLGFCDRSAVSGSALHRSYVSSKYVQGQRKLGWPHFARATTKRQVLKDALAQGNVSILGQTTVEFGRLPLTESSSDVVLWLISVKVWKVSKCFRKTSVTSSDVFESSALLKSDFDRARELRRPP